MTTRSFRGVKKVGPHCPSWGVLVEEFKPEGRRYVVKLEDVVRVQFRKGQEIHEARVKKIVADKETGEVKEVTVVLLDAKQFRTVTPDKIQRVPSTRQEEIEDREGK